MRRPALNVMRRWVTTGAIKSNNNVPPRMPTERLIKVRVNGSEVQVPDSATIMQACALAGKDIPRFCYHERLAVAGNCRMCVVQVNGGAKLVASCAAPIMPDMRIETDSPAVKKGREGVMEFLLANHPLDCPICDQGGECDLQDQAMAFGSDQSRFQINRQMKRAVEDKDLGPLVKTSMNRCIHCTRCVRFANEIAGAPELGTSGRGNDMQIGTFISKMVDNPLSGNIIDLCPVGALTSKPYAFVARPWELRRTDTIDVMDAVGANVKVDSRGMEVLRVIPRVNEAINEEWLADKGRFAYDGLRRQRLVQPLIRNGTELVPVGWEEALRTVADKLLATPSEKIISITGRFADVESTFSIGELFASLGAGRPLIDGCSIDATLPAELLKELRFTTSIEAVEQADALLLIGCNPKRDAPLLNARIRKAYLRNNMTIGVIGMRDDLTYETEHLGEDYRAIKSAVLEGQFGKKFALAKRPAIIAGQDAIFNHPNATETLNSIIALGKKYHSTLFAEGGSGLNMLPLTAGITGALMMGSIPKRSPASAQFVYLLAADDFDPTTIPPDAFIVYQGHHGDRGAMHAHVILPASAYTEKDATYCNMEGRPQQTRAAVPVPGEAREDWSIIRALSEFAGLALPWNTLDELRGWLSRKHPEIMDIGSIPKSNLGEAIQKISIPTGPAQKTAIPYGMMPDYYLTDCISRNSPTMAKCSLAFTHKAVQDSEKLETLEQ